jgi:uracil-DNA glycosylase
MGNGLIGIDGLGSKEAAYAALVVQRRRCRKCSDVVNPSVAAAGRFDAEGYIGPWTDWQGNLNAEIMVIGQEWGGEDNYIRQAGRDNDSDPTNKNLVTLITRGLGRSLVLPSACQGKPDAGDYFFTNAVLCLRKGAATSTKGFKNDISEQSFSNCGRTFLRPQIELIKPRLVLALGKSAWNGLMTAFGRRFDGSHQVNFERGAVRLNDSTTAIPLYHCGSKANLNRPIALQEVDWCKVRRMLEGSVWRSSEGGTKQIPSG